jgi:hypothetical protein
MVAPVAVGLQVPDSTGLGVSHRNCQIIYFSGIFVKGRQSPGERPPGSRAIFWAIWKTAYFVTFYYI